MKLAITVHNLNYLVIILDLKTGKEVRLEKDGISRARMFGITYDTDRIYLASERRIASYDKYFKKGRIILNNEGWGLHQIIRHKNALWAVSCRTNGIYKINIPSYTYKHFFLDRHLNLLDQNPYVKDTNHINCIYFNQGHLYLSCHNNDNPSFILKYKHPGMILKGQYVLGDWIHNMLITPNKIWTLDSAGTRSLISTKGERIKLGNEKHFLRGLCATPEWFIVGKMPFNKHRHERLMGDSEVLMISRKSRKVESKFKLQDTGEIDDMRLLDTYDLCHGRKPIWDAHTFLS